jgi:hypothetical protein
VEDTTMQALDMLGLAAVAAFIIMLAIFLGAAM